MYCIYYIHAESEIYCRSKRISALETRKHGDWCNILKKYTDIQYIISLYTVHNDAAFLVQFASGIEINAWFLGGCIISKFPKMAYIISYALPSKTLPNILHQEKCTKCTKMS